ncbi:MAG: DNA polymerase Y family protein [Bacteroidales bacterium]
MERASRGDLASLAREFSPRVEVHRPGLVTLDARGLGRLFGDVDALARELRQAAAARGLPARVALAPTRTAAWLMAHARAGVTIVREGDEHRVLAPLPLHVLEQLAANGLGPGCFRTASGSGIGDRGGRRGETQNARTAGDEAAAVSLLAVLKRWGLKTVGELAMLPTVALSERLGQHGLAWQRVARGEEMMPLVPDEPEERFEASLELEWPIEGLQPLSFVFGRLFDELSTRLGARDRAAAVLHVELQLVTKQVERRTLQLPAPMREARVLRTLALLNLEAHPVTDGIDRVTVRAEPVPGRVIQCSLLTRAVPFPEQLSTLLARLSALMGDRRCGMAALVDSHRPGAFEMKPFDVTIAARGAQPDLRQTTHDTRRPSDPRYAPGAMRPASPPCVLRRFRMPIPASVLVEDGRPVRVAADRAGLRSSGVDACAGPWRSSGEWWRVSDARVQSDGSASRPLVGWDRDEWDVTVANGVYRIYRDRDRDRWYVDGVVD